MAHLVMPAAKSKRVSVLVRDIHFWVVVLLVAVTSVLYYSRYLGLHSFISRLFGSELASHTVDHLIFLIPITYAGIAYGLSKGLGVTFLTLLLGLFRPVLVDFDLLHVSLEIITMTMVAGVATAWMLVRAREKKRNQRTLADLEVTHRDLQHYVRAARSSEKRLVILNAFSARLSQSLELRAVARDATEMLAEMLEVEIALLFLHDEEKNSLVLAGHQGVSQAYACEMETAGAGGTFLDMVAPARQPVTVGHFSSDHRFDTPEARRMKIELMLIVPVRYEDRAVGVLCAGARRPRVFLQDELELLTSIAGQIGVFAENARLYHRERRMQENLRFYLQHFTRAHEDERRRIARELHDDTMQVLYAIARQLDSFSHQHPGMDTDSAQFIKGLQLQVTDAVASVRRFSQDLRPPMLDRLGLLSALRWYLGEVEKQSGMKTEFRTSGTERRFSPEAELTLFRITQEAIRNAEKHAHAARVEVCLSFDVGGTRIIVKDDGVGFAPSDDTHNLVRSGKLGLAGMHERARLLGGTLGIRSTPGKGTTILLETPLAEQPPD